MKTNRFFLSALILIALGAGDNIPALAQDSANSAKEHSPSTSSSSKGSAAANETSPSHPHRISAEELRSKVTKVNKASNFIGMTVKNLQNDNLGKVEDLAISPDSGKIAYAV